jgi:hypothetical protein
MRNLERVEPSENSWQVRHCVKILMYPNQFSQTHSISEVPSKKRTAASSGAIFYAPGRTTACF